MKRALLIVALALVMLSAGYFLRGVIDPAPGRGSVPTVATSVDFIREIGELHVLRASVKEIVTSKVGEASWLKTPGKLAIICHFDIKYKYNLRKAQVVAGARGDGTRYCMIHLPRHEFEVSTRRDPVLRRPGRHVAGVHSEDAARREDPCARGRPPAGRTAGEDLPGRAGSGNPGLRPVDRDADREGVRLHGHPASNSTRLPLDRPGLRADIDTGLPRDSSSEACGFCQEDAVAHHLPHINHRVFTVLVFVSLPLYRPGSRDGARNGPGRVAGRLRTPADRPGPAGGGHGRLVHVPAHHRREHPGPGAGRAGRRGGGQQGAARCRQGAENRDVVDVAARRDGRRASACSTSPPLSSCGTS